MYSDNELLYTYNISSKLVPVALVVVRALIACVIVVVMALITCVVVLIQAAVLYG